MSKISKERKAAYYIGLGMIILGFILFISVFFSVSSFMNNDPLKAPREPLFMNSVIGVVLMISGAIVMNIGAKGAAGSGILLDPDKARDDLKPFNEAKGKMINDVIRNIDTVDDLIKPRAEKEVIKIKCRNCGSLNDEDAKFCKGCGQEL